MKWVALMLAVLGICAGTALAQDFPYDRFARANISEIAKELADQTSGMPSNARPGSQSIDPRVRRHVVRVTYRGSRRPIDELTAKFLRSFQTAIQAPGHWAELYEEEYLFVDGKTEYWLPVQKAVAAHFSKELQPGEAVDLYVVSAGGVLTANGWKWVLAVQEFQALGQPT
jgi:hypothetical protein